LKVLEFEFLESLGIHSGKSPGKLKKINETIIIKHICIIWSNFTFFKDMFLLAT